MHVQTISLGPRFSSMSEDEEESAEVLAEANVCVCVRGATGTVVDFGVDGLGAKNIGIAG